MDAVTLLPAAGTSYTDNSMAALPPSLANSKDPGQIAATAQNFESVFLSQMLQPMFEGVSITGWGDDENSSGGGEIYRSWLIDQYGKMIAQHGGIGLAGEIQNEMMKLQEVKP